MQWVKFLFGENTYYEHAFSFQFWFQKAKPILECSHCPTADVDGVFMTPVKKSAPSPSAPPKSGLLYSEIRVFGRYSLSYSYIDPQLM